MNARKTFMIKINSKIYCLMLNLYFPLSYKNYKEITLDAEAAPLNQFDVET